MTLKILRRYHTNRSSCRATYHPSTITGSSQRRNIKSRRAYVPPHSQSGGGTSTPVIPKFFTSSSSKQKYLNQDHLPNCCSCLPLVRWNLLFDESFIVGTRYQLSYHSPETAVISETPSGYISYLPHAEPCGMDVYMCLIFGCSEAPM